MDDALDFTASSEQVGKPSGGNDLQLGLATAPVLYASVFYPDQLRPLIDRQFTQSRSSILTRGMADALPSSPLSLNGDDVQTALALVQSCPGVQLTNQLAKWHSQQAVDAILAHLPPRPARDMLWRVQEPVAAGSVFEFTVQALVLPTTVDLTLFSTASLSVGSNGDSRLVASSTATLAVYCRGRYLNHLPALYEQDEFMGRFLMLFESFWRPISQQIAAVHNYLDPGLTPPNFLPWLAGWFDMSLDDQWDEDQQRELIKSLIWLFRRRGTRAALQRTLEILTREPVEIVERRAKNLTLGKSARLGIGVALGTANQPHMFTVRLRLRPLPAPAGLEGDAAASALVRQEKKRRDLIEQIIEAGKPAHTRYKLEITPVAAAAS